MNLEDSITSLTAASTTEMPSQNRAKTIQLTVFYPH